MDLHDKNTTHKPPCARYEGKILHPALGRSQAH